MSQFDLLSHERQVTLEGDLEPLPSEPVAPLELPEVDDATAELFEKALQLPLPLERMHLPVSEGVPPHDCVRGFRIGGCPHHDLADMQKVKVKAETCARQRCESSRYSNTIERAGDCWDGTARTDGKADLLKRRGLRHFGAMPWGVFVFTVPPELRPLCVGARLRKWRQAMGVLSMRVMQRHAGSELVEFYGRGWLHPVGDAKGTEDDLEQLEDGQAYHPHENIFIPLVGWDTRYERPKRVEAVLPSHWLGASGWVNEELVRIYRAIFGSSPAVVNWFYEYRGTPAKKAHALKYFARVFPQWARHPEVALRPRAFGLAHWKKKEQLYAINEDREPLPAWDTCAGCFEAGEVVASVVGYGPDETSARQRLRFELERHAASCERCGSTAASGAYVQHRRIMGGGAQGPPPSEAPPSTAEPPERPLLEQSAPKPRRETPPMTAADWRSSVLSFLGSNTSAVERGDT